MKNSISCQEEFFSLTSKKCTDEEIHTLWDTGTEQCYGTEKPTVEAQPNKGKEPVWLLFSSPFLFPACGCGIVVLLFC